MPTIAAAAIKAADGRVFTQPPPARHHTLIAEMNEAGCDDVRYGRAIQGFVTDAGEFVSRVEAGRIAHAAGQITTSGRLLFSEDLW
jgi:hypothetical protein